MAHTRTGSGEPGPASSAPAPLFPAPRSRPRVPASPPLPRCSGGPSQLEPVAGRLGRVRRKRPTADAPPPARGLGCACATYAVCIAVRARARAQAEERRRAATGWVLLAPV